MIRLLALAGAVALVTACSSGRSDNRADPRADRDLSGGYASPTGAAFMGYHGPMHRRDPGGE